MNAFLACYNGIIKFFTKKTKFIGEENYSSYKWLIDGNTKSGWNSNTIVLYGDEYARGMYVITAIATDSDGNRRSYTAQVTIN